MDGLPHAELQGPLRAIGVGVRLQLELGPLEDVVEGPLLCLVLGVQVARHALLADRVVKEGVPKRVPDPQGAEAVIAVDGLRVGDDESILGDLRSEAERDLVDVGLGLALGLEREHPKKVVPGIAGAGVPRGGGGGQGRGWQRRG